LLSGSGEVRRAVRSMPWGAGLNDCRTVQRPAFQHLPKTLASGKSVSTRERELVANVERTVPIELGVEASIAIDWKAIAAGGALAGILAQGV